MSYVRSLFVPEQGFNGVETGAPPSTYAVQALVNGEQGAVKRVASLTALRGLWIVPGLYVAGRMFKIDSLKGWKLVGAAGVTSASISLFMIGYCYLRQRIFDVQVPPMQTPPAPRVIDTTGEPVGTAAPNAPAGPST